MSSIKSISIVVLATLLSLYFVEILAGLILPSLDEKITTEQNYGLSTDGLRYLSNCDSGKCANPGVYDGVNKKVTNTGEMVYSVTYTIGENNFRITPLGTPSEKTMHMRFYGGSFVFGEGLNDNETLPYFLQSSSPQVKAENFGFHGYGVHNAYYLLDSQRPKKGAYNLLLTGTYHALRSGCVPSWSVSHPRYELTSKGELEYVGKCASKTNKGWVVDLYHYIDDINRVLNSRVLDIFSDFFKSSFTNYQLELYKSLISEFYHASEERGEIPLILYMGDSSRSYITAGYFSDPMKTFFADMKYDFVDVSLPSESGYFLHDLDWHPSAMANCIRAKRINEYLKFSNDHLICE